MFQFLKNVIGTLLGYGSCDCGNTFWDSTDNPGIYYGNGSGRIICDKCYAKNKAEIDEQNRRMTGSLDTKDFNCEHDWQRQGAASWWCPKCNSTTSVACQHGGSIACSACTDEWEQRLKKEPKIGNPNNKIN